MTDNLFGMTDEEFERITKSSEYVELLSRMQDTSPRFKSLPENQQKFAVALCLAGKTDIVPGLWRMLQKRPIPTVDEFLTLPYIGQKAAFYAQDTPWKIAIRDLFDPNKKYLEAIIAGAIGVAKTSNALLMHSYNLFRVNSLRRPQLTMGSGIDNKPMSLQLMSVNLRKTGSTILTPMVEQLKASQYYQQVNKPHEFMDFDNENYEHITPWVDMGDYILFPHNVKIVTGSRDYHALGEDLFGGFLDEAEGRTLSGMGNTVQQVFDTYSQIVTRIRSRFLNSRFILSTLVSQVAGDTGVMSTYIKEKQGGDDFTKIISFNIWEIRYPDEMAKGHWYCVRGTKTHPSKNLSPDEKNLADEGKFEVPPGCELIKYPIRFFNDFQRNVEQHLRELAGVCTVGDEKPFDDLTNIVDNNLLALVDIDATLGEMEPLWKQIPHDLYNMTPEGPRFKRFNGLKRYIHVDNADTGIAGVALVHKELSRSNKVIIVTDLLCRITSKNRISAKRMEQFLTDFKNVFSLNIAKITTDQYQSTALRQHIEANNTAEVVEHQSVDTKATAYQTWSNCIADGSFKIGPCDPLKVEMGNIFIEKNKPYVTTGRKDMSDAVCGAVFNAITNASDVPHCYYEDYNDSLNRKFDERLPDGFTTI